MVRRRHGCAARAGWSTALAALRLPADAHVLVVPIPVSTFTEPLSWQAEGRQLSLTAFALTLTHRAGFDCR
jgi:hypothetical protein